MTDDDLTGPWLLALGTLAIGIGAITAKILQQRNERDDRDSNDEIP